MKLTPGQARIWRAIGRLEARLGYCPNLREVMQEADYYTTSAVTYNVEALVDLGLVCRGGFYGQRTLHISSGVTVLRDGSVYRMHLWPVGCNGASGIEETGETECGRSGQARRNLVLASPVCPVAESGLLWP